MKLRPQLLTLLFMAALASALCITLPSDVARYTRTSLDEGIIGVLLLPSVLVFHLLYLTWAVLFFQSLLQCSPQKTPIRRFRMVWIASLCAYLLSILGIAYLRSSGMFAFAAIGLLYLFVLVPSAVCLVACILGAAVYHLFARMRRLTRSAQATVAPPDS